MPAVCGCVFSVVLLLLKQKKKTKKLQKGWRQLAIKLKLILFSKENIGGDIFCWHAEWTN